MGRQSAGGTFLRGKIDSNLWTILEKAFKGPSKGLLCLRPVKTSKLAGIYFLFFSLVTWLVVRIYIPFWNICLCTLCICTPDDVPSQQFFIVDTPRFLSGLLQLMTHCHAGCWFVQLISSSFRCSLWSIWSPLPFTEKSPKLKTWAFELPQTWRSAYVQKTSSTFCPLAWVCHPSIACIKHLSTSPNIFTHWFIYSPHYWNILMLHQHFSILCWPRKYKSRLTSKQREGDMKSLPHVRNTPKRAPLAAVGYFKFSIIKWNTFPASSTVQCRDKYIHKW